MTVHQPMHTDSQLRPSGRGHPLLRRRVLVRRHPLSLLQTTEPSQSLQEEDIIPSYSLPILPSLLKLTMARNDCEPIDAQDI